MKTGYPLGMGLYNKFGIIFLSLNNSQLIKKFKTNSQENTSRST
jgi:hypothetical protein